jgi:acetoin utilization protein AcuB
MRLQEMVSGWMTDRPVTIAPDRPIIEAYALMTEHEIRHIPVLEAGRLVGIVSDRDLHRATPLKNARRAGDVQQLFTTPVSEIMTREGFVTVDPQTTLGEAAKLLVHRKVSSLPVLDGERLVGIVTTHDLLRALMGMPRERPA